MDDARLSARIQRRASAGGVWVVPHKHVAPRRSRSVWPAHCTKRIRRGPHLQLASQYGTHSGADVHYPENCLRGIPGQKQVVEDGLVESTVFFFSENHVRDDGVFEQSVNWDDDESALPFTLAQKREDGLPHFRGGVAVVPRSDLDRLSKLPVFRGDLSYERRPLEGNRYHGNLLLSSGVSKQRRRAMAATLAAHVTRIVPQAESTV